MNIRNIIELLIWLAITCIALDIKAKTKKKVSSLDGFGGVYDEKTLNKKNTVAIEGEKESKLFPEESSDEKKSEEFSDGKK